MLKKKAVCPSGYEFETGKFLMEYSGLRIATRALNLKDSFKIRYRLDKNKPLKVEIENIKFNVLFKSNKISDDNN